MDNQITQPTEQVTTQPTPPLREAYDRIDWSLLLDFYTKGETITLSDVADKFGVPTQTVRDYAAKNNWTATKQKVLQMALSIMEERNAKEIAKRNEEHVKQARLLQGVGLEAIAREEKPLRPTYFDDARKAIETGQRLERLALKMDDPISTKVEIESGNGQKIHITWGNGKELSDYDTMRRERAEQERSQQTAQPVPTETTSVESIQTTQQPETQV